jgi:hypothetical protein
MGARISIQFQTKGEMSCVLYSHHMGESVVRHAKVFVKLCLNSKKNTPEFRGEPDALIATFYAMLLRISPPEDPMSPGFRILPDGFQNDDDHGHWVVQFPSGDCVQLP